ncbi:stabilizer of axonemal microtubules 2 isoform X1 [Lagopus muta]|uniref:stabilizer of axonemal microtubules 2 isoform X1 n=1 Tax=Lagopus muta TaxID=64668 RepID=UPI0020A0D4AE|nr:stabilizer of axonemal microtubules 2 isoform X1 [Lagopus muta]
MGRPRCLCEICTCGRHRCPHRPTRIYDNRQQLCLTTEYVEKYPKYSNISPARSLKPKQEYQAHRGKMEGITTFKSDYLPYDIVKRPFRVQEEYKPKTGELELGTTYKKDYYAHEIQPVTLVRPLERKHTTGGKLDTIPTYQDVPFDSTTSHRSSYVAHRLEPKFVKSKEEYKPSSQPFEDLTTHRNDFKGLPGPLARSCKPENAKVQSSDHFSGVTEFQDRFQPWPVSLPEARKSKEYVPPPGNMDFNSTSRLHYVKHEISPAVPVRPISNARRTSAPFQGNTTMKEDFKAWASSRQEIIKKQQEIPKPTGKFYDLTTFKSHYIPHHVVPARSFKPVHVVLPNSAHFQDETMYRTEYTPKKQEICPANYTSPPGYIYVNTDSHGHKFFRQLSPEFSELNSNHIPKEVAVVS